MNINLKYFNLYKKCPYLLSTLSKKRKSYFELQNKLYTLINFFLYKKFRNMPVDIGMMKRKWNKLIPLELVKSTYNRRFFSCFEKFFNKFVNKKLNIICVCNPVQLKIFDVNIQGYIDLVIEKDGYYNVHLFNSDISNSRGIPGIIIHSFLNEFRKNNIKIIMEDVVHDKIKHLSLRKDLNFYISESIRIIENISWKSKPKKDSCKGCNVKRLCYHGKF